MTLTAIQPKYTLFVSDLFLYHGGVSDYTDHFARQLKKHGRLGSVFTPFASQGSAAYRIDRFPIRFSRHAQFLDKWVVSRKIATLFYYVRLYFDAYRGLKKMALSKKEGCIIFTEYYTRQFDIIIYCARLMGIPYGIVFHGLDLLFAKKSRLRHFIRNFNKARFIIYNSAATKKLAGDLFQIQHPHSTILHPGIDPALANGLQRDHQKGSGFRKSSDQIILSTVSRLIRRKGIDIGIRIAHALSGSNIRLRYYIGGMGEDRQELENLVRSLNAEDYIIFLGEISHEEKFALLNESDFFLLPNHSAGKSDFEGFGISFLEASLFGNVLIGGTHGGVQEAVLNLETGYLFDFDDSASAEKAIDVIKDCIANPDLMERIKRRGIAYVKEHYDWNHLIDRFFEMEAGLSS
ncbi:MAG: glycosyltransferase family 4 protein [Chitinophagales bacterium]